MAKFGRLSSPWVSGVTIIPVTIMSLPPLKILPLGPGHRCQHGHASEDVLLYELTQAEPCLSGTGFPVTVHLSHPFILYVGLSSHLGNNRARLGVCAH